MLVIACVLISCSSGEVESDAGIAVPVLALSAEPIFVLGEDGTPEKMFSSVVARRTASGEVVVGDMASVTVTSFLPDGSFSGIIAGKGTGPGEVEGRFIMELPFTDTLVTVGIPPGSPPDVSLFSLTDGFVERVRMHAPNGQPPLTGAAYLGLGNFLVERGLGFTPISTLPDPPALIPDSATYGILRTAGKDGEASLVWLPAVQRFSLFTYHWPGGVVPVTMSLHAAGHRTYVVASGSIVWVVESGSGSLSAYDTDGESVVTSTLPLVPRPFDPAALVRAREAAVSRAASARDSSGAMAMYDKAILPPSMPLVSEVHSGPDNGLWLRVFELEPGNPQHFIGVNSAGEVFAQAMVPAGLAVQQFGPDYVLGVMKDERDVPSVVVYSMATGQ